MSARDAGAGTPVTLFRSMAGPLDFTSSGATFLTSGSTACNASVNANASATLSGIPATATIRAAYLYWAASTDSLANVDDTVTFQSQTRVANRTFTETFPYNGNDHFFYSGFDDVTDVVAVSRNGTYTMSGLNVHTGTPHCNVAAVLGGWSMVVIYEDAAEPLRVVNVWDGFRYFRASQIVLTPTNFRVPNAPATIDGKLGHLSWEGDQGNSQDSGGFTEELAYNNGVGWSSLINTWNAAANQFNSTVSDPGSGQTNVWGVDVDIYDISSLLVHGSNTGNTRYGSGNDLVLLTAEIFSVTNTPVADLSIGKSHTGDFLLGNDHDYTLTVDNNGPSDHSGLITVTDTLPSGLSYVGVTGSGWSCSVALPSITCTRSDALAAGASHPDITVTVNPTSGALPSVTNSASVVGTLFDNISGNDGASDVTTVLGPDLSTSTKTWIDLDGGDQDPGDTIRYTITLTESAGVPAAGVQVADDIPADVSGFTVTSIPPGATDASVIGGGANSTGLLDVQGIAVPASGSVTIEFEVTINSGVAAGTTIDNTATVTPSVGTGATPAAPTLTVSASSIPSTGVKPLYLHGEATLDLSRTPPATAPVDITIRKDVQPSRTWTLIPSLAAPLEMGTGNFPVVLYLRRNNNNAGSQSRTLQVEVASTSLGLIGSVTQGVSVFATPQAFTFDITPSLGLPATLPLNDVVTVTVTNVTPGGGARRIRLFPVYNSNYSRAELNANRVVNVDSVAFYDAAYSGGTTPGSFAENDAVYVRAVVSDPFGSFDITSATVEILDPGGSPVDSGSMTEVNDSGSAVKTYEYLYTLPAAADVGGWTARVTANEGSEANVSHLRTSLFSVTGTPDLLVLKSVSVIDDPVNGSSNPKAIPGANVLYVIQATNQGAGTADSGSVVITDTIPVELDLFVGDLGGPGSGPVLLLDGTPGSGLTLPLDFGGLSDGSDEVEFDDGGGTFSYFPTSTGGYDSNVRAIRISPSGPFVGAASSPYPSFQIRMRARIR